MMLRSLALALLALGVASCGSAPAADPAKPASYALNLPIEPAAGASLQRLTLPPEALVAMQRHDLGDVRLFDARDRIVPLALVNSTFADNRHSSDLTIYPLVGPAATLTGNALANSGVSIRIEQGGVARIVSVDTAAPAPSTPANAALLDTHALREPVHSITLDAAIPAGQAVTMTLQSSANLSDWQPLAEKTLFRPEDGPALLGGATITLPGVNLAGRYVAVSWGAATGVALNGASVATSIYAPPARAMVATTPLTLDDPHDLRFALPPLARLAGIRLVESGPDGVIPVRLYGRDNAEAPWTLLSAATLQPGERGASLDLGGPPMHSYRIEADRRTAGFSTAPRMMLEFDAVQMLVALSGTPPYRLAVGHPSAPAAFLSLSEIAPQAPPRLADIAEARIVSAAGTTPVVTLQPGAADGALAPRKLMLWGALLLGTLALAFAAIRLMRAAAPPVTPAT